LKDDPGETKNLARRNPSRAQAMRNRLETWRKSVGAAMPAVNPGYDPAKADQGLAGAEPATPTIE
jgi:arylsulfatase A